MICPLHGDRGHVNFRGPPTPPPQLAAVAGHRCRSRDANNERRRPRKDNPSNAPCSTYDVVANDSFYLTERRPFSPGYGWAEPGKGWTRYSNHGQSNCYADNAGTAACPRRGDTRRVFKEIHAHSSKTPLLSGEMSASGESYRVPSDVFQVTSEVTAQEKLGRKCARDTAWAMSFLSIENNVPQPERVPRNASGKIARRHELQRKHQPAKSRNVETSTTSRQRSAAHLSETRAMNHKLDSARMYNKGLRDSNSELARQVVALRRKVDAIVAPTSNNAPGRPEYATSIDEQVGQDGGTTDPGAHGKKFTTADMAADKKSITTSPKGSSQNDSPKGVGRDGRRERGVPGMKQRTCKRLDSPVSHRPTEGAYSATMGRLPEMFNTKRVPGRAKQERQQARGRTRSETHAGTRLEVHAQTQTEAVSPAAEHGVSSVAAAPVWKPVLLPETSHESHSRGSPAGVSTHSWRGMQGEAHDDTGAIAAAHPPSMEHAGARADSSDQTGSRRVGAEPPASRKGYCREEFRSCEGSEPQGRPEGSAGIDAEARRVRDDMSDTSVYGTQRCEDDFLSAETVPDPVGAQGRVAVRESADKDGRGLLGDEGGGQQRGSKLDTQDSGNCGSVGANQEDGSLLPGRCATGAASTDATTMQEENIHECSVASAGELIHAVERRGIPPPLFGDGCPDPSLPLQTSPLRREMMQAPRMSPARTPAVQAGSYTNGREEAKLVESATHEEEADHTAREEVKQLQRKLLDAKHAVAAFKLAFVLARVTPTKRFEIAGIGLDRFAALSLSGRIPRIALAFARWRSAGVTASTCGVVRTGNITLPAETSPPGGSSSPFSISFPETAEEASASAAAGSLKASVGGFDEENTFRVEETSSNGSVERARDGEAVEQDEKKNASLMESRSPRPLSPPVPLTPPTPRSRTEGSNVPILPTAEARLLVDGSKDSRVLAIGDSSSKETLSPKTSSLLLNNYRTAERGYCQTSSDVGRAACEAPHGDDAPATDGFREDRAAPQPWRVPEKEEDFVLASGKDEPRTRERKATDHRELAGTASSAEGRRQQQKQESEIGESGRHSALGLGHVGLDGATAQSSQQETAAEEESGGACGGGESVLQLPSPPCTTLDESRGDAECSFAMDSCAAENKKIELKDVEIDSVGLWDRREDQIRAAYTAADQGEEERKGCLDRGCSGSPDKGLVLTDVGIRGQGEHEHASSNDVAEEEEVDTDASYRRDCAVLAGTAKVVFALVALEHRRVSSRFYRWKRTRHPPLDRLQQPRPSGQGGVRIRRRPSS